MENMKTELGVGAFILSMKALAALFSRVGRLNQEIKDPENGFVFNARYQFATRDDSFYLYLIFADGKVRARRGKIDNPDVTVFYKDKETLARIFSKSPDEALDYLLTNEMSYTGNMAYLTKFSYMTTLLAPKLELPEPLRQLAKLFKGTNGNGKNGAKPGAKDVDAGPTRRKYENEILDRKVDKVEVLDDPYLGRLSLDDFPRLGQLKNLRYAQKPAVCAERADLITQFYKKYGFENDSSGKPWDPVLRQAQALEFVLQNKKPLITTNQLVPGSTTAKEVGIPVYPELIGTAIWPELSTISTRELNPNDLSDQEAEILNRRVFPFWMKRNVREFCRAKFGNPLSQQLEERFVLYFMMKNNAISHTIPGFKKVLDHGTKGLAEQAALKEKRARKPEKKRFYQSLATSLAGVEAYAGHLADEADRRAKAMAKVDPERARELSDMADACRRAPKEPAATLQEAVYSIWITFACLHQENANSALSIGRLDQLLQPYFLSDVEQLQTPEEKNAYIRQTLELVGCLFLKFNDHDPLMPNVGNKLFGGSSSDDTVTVGGVDEAGENAVCDMTYILLKASEMLCFQDPNMNARYFEGVNSPEYLRRVMEVNANTVSQPAVHNDEAMIRALVSEGIPLEEARDWGATGCVEPSIAGRHYGHTNCMFINMVAPLEMALNNGVHPVMAEKIGLETGDPVKDFPTFDDFYTAFKKQLRFLIDQSVEINNYLGIAHQHVRPTPLLSAVFEGPLEKGKDLISGGAKYNTSGVAMVSIPDAVDSLLAIRELIYEKKELDFPTLLSALEADFENPEGPAIHARLMGVKKFGSDDPETVAFTQEIMDFVYQAFEKKRNYRGGRYLPGYWSVSYHVGFGMLSGALPSGRKKGKAFTPGLTPSPHASDSVLDNIRAVASLSAEKMPNNIAFNVKLAPHAADGPKKNLDHFVSYIQSYFHLGGMQWQSNIVNSDTLKDAAANPDDYKWLLVRISGYNAYFVKLNPNMQQELIERAQFG